jgi:hypothetical protein
MNIRLLVQKLLWGTDPWTNTDMIHKVCNFCQNKDAFVTLCYWTNAPFTAIFPSFVTRRYIIIAEARIQFQISPIGICRAPSVTRTGISPSTSAFSCVSFLQCPRGMWPARPASLALASDPAGAWLAPGKGSTFLPSWQNSDRLWT